MPTIENLGNGSGYVYITQPNGATVVSVVENTSSNLLTVILKAKSHKGVANHADNGSFFENTYRYFLNDDAGADIDDLSGSLEITDWLVGRGFEGLFPQDGFFSTPSDGTVTVKRKGSVQIITIRSTVLLLEVDTILRSDKTMPNDILIVRSGSASAGVIFSNVLLKNGDGNMVLNGDCDLNGDNRYIMLRWDSIINKWVEMFRNPAPFAPTVLEARANGFSVNGDGHTSALITSGGGVVVNPNTQGRYITLSSPFPQTLIDNFDVTASEAKAGDFYFVRIQAQYTVAGGDIRLFGTPITGSIIPSNTSFSNPATVVCLYSGSSWQFFCTVDISRYNLDFDELRAKRYAKVTYDFAVQTGAIGTYTIGNNVIPADSVIDINNAIIVTKTALTSGGSAQVAVGLDGDDDAIDGFRNFNFSPYNAVNATTKVNSTVNNGAAFIGSSADITFTISTAALTAGKVDIYVPYTKA